MGLGARKGFEITPPVKYDARHGTVYFQDRVRDNKNNWVTEQRDIPIDDFEAIFDMANLERGWIAYPIWGA